MSKLGRRLLVIGLAVISQFAPPSGNAIASESCPKVGFTVVEPHPSSETRAIKVGRGQTIYVRQVPITTTSDIVEIKLADHDDGDYATLLIKFTPPADQRLHEATTNHSGMRIAFMADDEVLLSVIWEGQWGMYTGGTQVSIQHGAKRARKLMKALQGCIGATAVDRTP